MTKTHWLRSAAIVSLQRTQAYASAHRFVARLVSEPFWSAWTM